ncbi:GPR19 [Mytilus coruscus]|uniref:GPR19 n=1 Tax=Mytilus coruscus TaxID=42192 RepID=A0A6J8C1G5_MYTCO|nr:GPR19 [Mytilus coruscus]
MNEPGLSEDIRSGQVVFLTLIICILWILCILGNVLVCLVIYRSRRVQSTTNYFIVGLACTDLLFAITALPWITGSILVGKWPFGDFMCRITRFLQHFTLGVTAFVLTSICVDRFYTIIYPLTFKVTRGTSKRMIGVACFVSMVFSSFSLYFYEEIVITRNNVSHQFCPTYISPETARWAGVGYIISILIIQYTSPVIIMIVLYAKVFHFIWRHSGVCLQFQRTMNSVPRTKVKMVKMLMITALSNIVLISPMYFLQLIVGFLKSTPIDNFWYYACVILVFSSSVIKPAIYMCYNSNFRRGCREVFCLSAMQCYRREQYTITNISSLGRRNHIGVMNCTSQLNSPSHTFDRAVRDEKNSWPLNGTVPSTSI